jgi:hypothetical protein
LPLLLLLLLLPLPLPLPLQLLVVVQRTSSGKNAGRHLKTGVMALQAATAAVASAVV